MYLDLYSVHNQLLVDKRRTFAQLSAVNIQIHIKHKERSIQRSHLESSHEFIVK